MHQLQNELAFMSPKSRVQHPLLNSNCTAPVYASCKHTLMIKQGVHKWTSERGQYVTSRKRFYKVTYLYIF